MAAHDGFDGLRGLIGVIEGNGGNVVMEDVRFYDPMHQSATDETEFTVDGRGRAAGVAPRFGGIMGERRIGVLEEGDGH